MSDHLTGGPIDAVFAALRTARPDIHIERLTVTYPADDDNLWYISVSGVPDDVQIGCHPDGQPPFLVEGNGTDQVLSTSDADRAAATILTWLSPPPARTDA
jgi:hypothetical protein